MNKLNIIRASAGSGKTHYLTGFFLKILMSEPVDYYKQILAVTFTNKATAEMKRRILQELDRLAADLPSDYLPLLILHSRLKESEIRKKSATLLQVILHDYSWFSIETIDSFFQRVIRGFTHEIGVPGNYSIEIETQPILYYAVDTFIDSIAEKSDVLTWLVHYTDDKIQQGKAWDIRHGLIKLGREIFEEKFTEHAVELTASISDKQRMLLFRKELMHTKSMFESRIAEIGKKGIEIIDSSGLNYDDFYQKANGAKKFFEQFSYLIFENTSGVPYPHTVTYQKLTESADNWPSASTKYKEEVVRIAAGKLRPMLIEAADFFEKNRIKYYSAIEILQNVYAVGILNEISEKIKEYRIEKNVFILSDSPTLIHRIIDQNDAPFIYEKMGNRYGHFLIDEFQDTSALQWFNFKPLISNSLSQGNLNLIVGDAKQSIYRWRNSNWEILAHRINDEYPADIIHYEELRMNWRSAEKIVLFNNSLFPVAIQKLKQRIEELLSGSSDHTEYIRLLDTIYSDTKQEFPRKSMNKGNVYVKFFSRKEIKQNEFYYQEILVSKINELLQKGYLLRDIAILVRDKKDGQTIANLLIELNTGKYFIKELNVLSEESLFLDASNAVSLIIAALQYLNNPSDSLVRAKIINSFEIHQNCLNITPDQNGSVLNGQSLTLLKLQTTLPTYFMESTDELLSLPLYDLTERLIAIFKLQDVAPEIPFIHAFLDVVHDFTAANPGNLVKFIEFWEEEGGKKTVPASESQNAIRVLTIHKAKGLEFKGVIIPFCTWQLDQKPNTILWTETRDTTFNYLPVLPLNYHKGLKNTEYASVYYSELFKSYVDNLNLLYVALTRSIDSLIIFPVFNDAENTTGKFTTVGDLLYESIARGTDTSKFQSFNSLTSTYELYSREEYPASSDSGDSTENYITCTKGRAAMGKIYFRSNGMDYFRNIKTPTFKGTVRGSVLHQILASVESHNDLDSAIKHAVNEGMITANEGVELREHISFCFQQNIVFSWFDGKGKVLAEKNIILPGGEVKRPDRVVLFPDHIHVIDYKFGSVENIEANKQQLRDYKACIQTMGYENVEAYLWYIDQNEVIRA
jgi:ATP-dependent helicase/nuclease subunit A